MKTRGDFKRTAKPNMVMQHSREFVLETHISNAKLTAALWERERNFLALGGKKTREIDQCAFLLMFLCMKTEQDVRRRGIGTFSARAGLEKSGFDLWVIWCTDAKSGAFAACCASPWPCSAWAAEPGQGGWQAEIGLSAALTLCFLCSSLN